MIINQKIDSKLVSSDKPAPAKSTAVFDSLYVAGLLGFLLYSFIYSFERFSDFTIEYVLLFLNGVLSTYGQMIAIKKDASIHYISFIFCYLFMSITPLIQIGHNHDPVFNMEYIALSAIMLSVVFTAVGVFYTRKIKNLIESPKSLPSKEGHYAILFGLTFLVSVVAIFLFRDALFTSREGFGLMLGSIFSNGPIALLAITFLMGVPFFGAAIGLRAAITNKKRMWTFSFGLLLVMAAIINNPFIQPRFKLAGLVFFFVDYIFKGKRMRLLVLLIMLGVATAPLFNVFRQNAPSANPVQLKFEFSDNFLSYDYDAFQLACYAILTVQEQGITWGANIAGAVLGFIPRSLWEGKPIQSSYIIYNTMIKYRFVGTDNLSTPLMAEGFYAFSWAGGLLIGLLYWMGISKLVIKSRENSESATFLVRCVFAGLVFIFLRGTLIVAIPSVIGACAAALIPWWVFGRRSR